MPSMTFLILYWLMPELIKPLTLVTLPFLFITTFLIPLLSISMLRVLGSISSLKLENRQERIMPFSFVSIFYGMTTYLFVVKIQVNETIAIILVSTTILILVLTAITFWVKISIHAAGISGVVGYFLVFGLKSPNSHALYPLLVLILAAGIVMSARLQLNAHSPKEILAGTITGLGICFNILYWFV